jgi:Helicase associated domain
MAPQISWDERFANYKDNKDYGVSNCNGMNCWMTRQRKAKADGTLSGERIEKLDSVGFVWTRTIRIRAYDCGAWNENFKLLEAHHREKGNFRGPYDKLPASWVHSQRQMLKNTESLDEIQQERWARLNTLGFWNATALQLQPSGNSDSDLDPTIHASHTTTSVNSNSESETRQGQQHSGVGRITVPVSAMARFAGEIKHKRDPSLP